jgi:hypothetical protein
MPRRAQLDAPGTLHHEENIGVLISDLYGILITNQDTLFLGYVASSNGS